MQYNYILSILIPLFIASTNAFILPPQAVLPILGSDLESILTTRAITSSIITTLRNEISGDRLLLQITDVHPSTFVYLSIAITFLYGQWKFYQGCNRIEKLQKIDIYVKKETTWKNIIIIMLYVFTKDVMSVS
jgi:hypothetical protein